MRVPQPFRRMSWLITGEAIYAKARATKCGIIQPSKATSEPRMVCEGKPVETPFGLGPTWTRVVDGKDAVCWAEGSPERPGFGGT
eukprot:s668_g28.t1